MKYNDKRFGLKLDKIGPYRDNSKPRVTLLETTKSIYLYL
jgi:hypothetical protein